MNRPLKRVRFADSTKSIFEDDTDDESSTTKKACLNCCTCTGLCIPPLGVDRIKRILQIKQKRRNDYKNAKTVYPKSKLGKESLSLEENPEGRSGIGEENVRDPTDALYSQEPETEVREPRNILENTFNIDSLIFPPKDENYMFQIPNYTLWNDGEVGAYKEQTNETQIGLIQTPGVIDINQEASLCQETYQTKNSNVKMSENYADLYRIYKKYVLKHSLV